MKKILVIIPLLIGVVCFAEDKPQEGENHKRIQSFTKDYKKTVQNEEPIKEVIMNNETKDEEIKTIKESKVEKTMTETEKIILNLTLAKEGITKLNNKNIEKEFVVRDIEELISVLKK